MSPHAYTAEEVADLLRLSVETIRRATRAGLLPCRRLGRAIRYTEDDVRAYLDAHRDAGYL